MKVNCGDLVKYKNLHGHVYDGKFISKEWVGLVTQVTGNQVEVLWNGLGIKSMEAQTALEVVSALCKR